MREKKRNRKIREMENGKNGIKQKWEKETRRNVGREEVGERKVKFN
jgi:hypothetical protein